MLFRKDGFPEEDELVMCTVTKVHINSVFVSVDDYQKQGMIHISEISPGRIRNIRDFVKEGKVIVCKVLRVSQERGQIDLSLRRVSEGQRRAKVEEMKQEQKAEKILEFVAGSLGKNQLEIYRDVFSKVTKHYDMMHHAFSAVVEENLSLEALGIEKKVAQALETEIRHRTRPSEVEMDGDFTITSYEPNGVEIIKETLQKAMSVSDKLSVRYVGGGKYHVTVIAPDYPEAERLLKEATNKAVEYAESHNSLCSFLKQER
jgi:translation initiation factor 2 subunit 1